MSVSFVSDINVVAPVNDGDIDDRGISLMALDQYMREVRKLERLTKEQERVLFERIERARCEPSNQYYVFLAKDARDRIIENYLPMVLAVVKKYVVQCSGMEWLDLVQEGNVFLLGAIERYHLGFEATFSTWAYIQVSMQLPRVLRDKGSFVHIPEQKHYQLKKLLEVEQALFVSLRREPLVADIAREMQMSEEKVRSLLAWRRYEQVQSLQTFLFDDQAEDDFPYTLLSSGNDVLIEEEVIERETCVALYRALLALPARTREIIRLQYGLEGQEQQTSREIADRFGMKVYEVAEVLGESKKVLRERLQPFYQEVA